MIEYSVDGVALDRDRMMILSLRPRFAEAILSGVKTVELRRTEPKIRVPTLALIYASTPVRALLGTCVVTSVESGHLPALWQAHGAGSGIDHGEFLQYFEGVQAGSALSLASPTRFSRPIPLVELRSRPKGFRPPQSFSYVDAKTGNHLLQMAA
jgi:predicted transcriptional regulator